MRKWVRRRKALVHSYSLVGHLCSPNKIVIADAKSVMDLNKAIYDDSMEELVKKLILDPTLVGKARAESVADLVDEFWTELNHFQNRTGMYNHDRIWISASKEDWEAHRWHQRNSLGGNTRCFGPLACLVTSKIGGSGTCERNWKQYKQAKTGKRNRLQDKKVKKQVAIYGRYQHIKGMMRIKKLATAHEVWEEADFDTLKLDMHCSEITESVRLDEDNNKGSRIFCAWEETW